MKSFYEFLHLLSFNIKIFNILLINTDFFIHQKLIIILIYILNGIFWI
jgi:hypothetical protein